jgi:uncharacterized protein YbjT (DUF2867 family)
MTTTRRGLLFFTAALAVTATGRAAAGAPREILVLGGSGALGAAIVRRLVAAGDRVTVFTRPGSDRARLAGLAVTWVEGDLLDPADIAALFAGRRFDAVVSAVRVETGDPTFYATWLPPVTRAMKAAGVAHFVHSGAVGAGANAAKFTGLGWDKVPGLLDRLRDQGIGEDVIRASGVPFTIIRNTRLWPEGTPATGKARLTADDSTLTPMTREDLAQLTVDCIGNPGCIGRTYHLRDDSLGWPPPRSPRG